MVWSRKLVDDVGAGLDRTQLRGRAGADRLRGDMERSGARGTAISASTPVSTLFRRAAGRARPICSNTNPSTGTTSEALRLRARTAGVPRGGSAQAERAIYDAAVRLAGCAASECVFVDDLAANVAGARAAGLRPCATRTRCASRRTRLWSALAVSPGG